jgi:drug/metabolite transporter (DMT)-like permease
MASQSIGVFPKTRLQADLTLLLVAALWGSSFAAQRAAAMQGGVHFYNGVRFLSGALLLMPGLFVQRKSLFINRERWAWLGGVFAGIALFAGTAFQQYGMQFTSAANAGFITGLYVIIVPFVLAIAYRKPPRWIIWLASVTAAAGMFLLSTGGKLALTKGDGWELAGAMMWTAHVLIIDSVTRKLNLFLLAVMQSTVCGLLSLGMGVWLEGAGLSSLTGIWWAVIWTAIASIALGFTLQAVGQRAAPPADAAIILSLESVFAAIFGWLILRENLSGIQIMGCVLMFAGMILAQLPVKNYPQMETSG